MSRLSFIIRIDGEQFEAYETIVTDEKFSVELGTELVYAFKEWVENNKGTWVDLQRGAIQE